MKLYQMNIANNAGTKLVDIEAIESVDFIPAFDEESVALAKLTMRSGTVHEVTLETFHMAITHSELPVMTFAAPEEQAEAE